VEGERKAALIASLRTSLTLAAAAARLACTESVAAGLDHDLQASVRHVLDDIYRAQKLLDMVLLVGGPLKVAANPGTPQGGPDEVLKPREGAGRQVDEATISSSSAKGST
jgi:hypothetical protein